MSEVIGTMDMENEDDIALADRMKAGREQVIKELRKLIVGQEEVIEQVLIRAGASSSSSKP